MNQEATDDGDNVTQFRTWREADLEADRVAERNQERRLARGVRLWDRLSVLAGTDVAANFTSTRFGVVQRASQAARTSTTHDSCEEQETASSASTPTSESDFEPVSRTDADSWENDGDSE